MFFIKVEVAIFDKSRELLLHSEYKEIGTVGLESEVEQADWPVFRAIKHTHDILLHQIVCFLAYSAVALLAVLCEISLQLDVLVVAWESVVQQKSF